MKDIYNSEFVEDLFNKMSGTYEKMNYITSFGFSSRWRKQCVNSVHHKEGHVVADLMTGMGECWKPILKKVGKSGKLIALDFSEGMLSHAKSRLNKWEDHQIEVLRENVFDNSIKSESVDSVISGFGIKTFNNEQLKSLAEEISRILKPNGSFSFVEVSVPKSKILRSFYMFYLKKCIPILGKLFLGNPETYRMLGQYTSNFENAEITTQIFKDSGFEVEYKKYFFGCSSGIVGRKLMPTQ